MQFVCLDRTVPAIGRLDSRCRFAAGRSIRLLHCCIISVGAIFHRWSRTRRISIVVDRWFLRTSSMPKKKKRSVSIRLDRLNKCKKIVRWNDDLRAPSLCAKLVRNAQLTVDKRRFYYELKTLRSLHSTTAKDSISLHDDGGTCHLCER